MHQHGKEDSSTSGSANEANAFGSNTFPLLSRSSMKRPFSLSSEREHQTPTIRDHFRSCRGFRSRSKTIHADTFTRTTTQYRDLIGSGNNSSFFSGYIAADHRSSASTKQGLFESNRNRKNHPAHHANLSSDKQAHLAIAESILDEEMAVDDSEEEAAMDGQLNSQQTDHLSSLSSGSRGKQHQVLSLHHSSLDALKGKNAVEIEPHHCPANKVNLFFGYNNAPGPQTRADPLESGQPKLAITYTPKPSAKCDKLASDFASKPVPNAHHAASQLDSSKGGSSLFHPAIQSITSLSPLAVPKPTASSPSSLESKASPFSGPATTAHIPTEAEKAQFQRSLDSATTLVFHRRTGLPLTSSPAPIRKYGTCFDFDSSLTSVNAIKKALFENDTRDTVASVRSRTSFSSPTTTSALLGNFEESVLNGRLEPASIVNGFTAEIGASGTFCPKHKTLPVTVFFYALQDSDKGEKISSPYLGHINLGPKGYHVPRQGTVQVTLFNPNGTVVKMFVVRYNLSDMPPSSRTFLRQRTLFMPSDASEHHADNRKWLRYLIHLRFQSSKSGRIRLHTDIRILVFRKHDLDVATLNGGVPYELRSFIQMPSNPKYSKNIKS